MDPAKMKVVDLRSELGALGLDTKGNKPALVERLKKALEAKTGKAIADTTILDTSTEDADEPATPRRAGPAARTRRRSSSTRVASTPAKVTRVETPEPIEEERSESQPEPVPEPEPEPEPVQPQPVPAPVEPEELPEVKPEIPNDSEMYSIDDEGSQSPPPLVKTDEEPMEVQEGEKEKSEEENKEDEKVKEGADMKEDEGEKNGDAAETAEERERELTEEEEWDQLNKRLEQKEKERIEREKQQAEEDAKRLEEISKDPVKLNRLKRKQEKKARWSNFYKAVEVTNEVLTPPVEEPHGHKRKPDTADTKAMEPDINDNKLTLSWYDSDLNQYLELPELVSVVPLSDGAFAHAWAGARASHGIGPHSGRVCYEVRVGSVVTTTETVNEKEVVSNGLRIGWSTDDSTLHLGEGELSFGYESTGRAVNNGEFKEYGKTFTEKDVIGVYLDLDSNPCKISYTLNGTELGVAHEFDRSKLGDRALFPHVLTKNTCYRVNFGNDQYNMLTKTKIVRKRIEIPVEQVLEEKRLREEEIQRQKKEREEAAARAREKRERDRKEREERQRKKREEREKQERERKEKEAQEKKDKAEEAGEKPAEGDKDKEDTDKEAEKDGADKDKEMDTEKEADKEKEMDTEIEADKEKEVDKDKEADSMDADTQEEPTENGDKPEESVEVKQEPMETESEAAKEVSKEAEEEKEEIAAENREDVKEEATEGEIPEVTEEQVLKGLTLDKRIKFVIRYTVENEIDGPEADLLPGYTFLAQAELVDGPRRPASLAECEVILMVGMPGAGKTHWVRTHVAAHPQRRYNILSTSALFDTMQVDCKPFRATCEGRWDAMLSKAAKCVLKLLEFAHGRWRNYILDQTNVYPSAQRRKLREFEGYKRIAVVVVPDAETYAERSAQREKSDGKEVPDGAVVDMKANFTLPEKCSWLDEVIYAELNEEEAKKIVEGFHKEAKAAGVVKEREKRERSANRDAPPMKRPRSGDRRHGRDDRRKDFGRDREDRWGGGGGGGNSRWGPANRGGGGGGRWGGPRDRPGPPQGRFDRPWGGRDNGGPPFNRDRDGFRGGRGGPGGPGGPGGHGGPMGPRGDRGPPRPDQRFGRGPDRNSRPPPQQDKRPGPPPHQGGGGAGSWQRGGQAGGRGGHVGARNNQSGPVQRPGPQGKDVQQNQQQGNQQQGWNQWANSGWGGWGNWNQNQAAWGNWGNWSNWNNAQQQQGQQAATTGTGGKGQAQQGQSQQATQQQWQQWYQWQQWQQQQGWPGYQQGQGNQQTGQASAQDQQAWAQYYQNYGANAAAGNAVADKK